MAEELADRVQFTIQQWFTTSEHYMSHAELLNGSTMPLEVGSMEREPIFPFPDVAHDAATVALIVDVEQEYGKFRDARLLQVQGRSRLDAIESQT